MNNNTILIIIFILVVLIFIFYSLYAFNEKNKKEKIKLIIEQKKKKEHEVIQYQKEDIPKSGLNKEEIKNRIIIRKEIKKENKDVISDAISEIVDFEQIKNKIINGQRNMTEFSIPEQDMTPLNILVVDDSNVFLRKTKDLLLSLDLNYNVTTAINGEVALFILNSDKDKFSLIITDMDMPKMDGGELINRIKEDMILNKIPIIVITGQPKLISNGLEDKVDGVLEKPYKDEDLIYQTKIVLSI